MRTMGGKVCVVTGATSGIGRATAHALAGQGACVVIVGRSERKCLAEVRSIVRGDPGASVDHVVADLSLQSDVHALAARCRSRYRTIDVLINNAGARFLERVVTAEGIEMTFALNHLASFLLTGLLLDALTASADGRIINVSSGAHAGCRAMDFEDLQGEKRYDGKEAYARSKLANLLFTYALARRLEGTRVTVNALQPGNVLSGFSRNNGWLSWAKHAAAHGLRGDLVGPRRGAETGVYLAASTEVAGVSGKYFSNKRAVRSSDASYDREAAERLWQVSLEMTGMKDISL